MMAIPRVWLAEFVILFPKLKMISVFSRVKIKKNAQYQTNIPPLKVKGISIIQWFCLDLLTVGFPIENSIFQKYFHFAVEKSLTPRLFSPSEYK